MHNDFLHTSICSFKCPCLLSWISRRKFSVPLEMSALSNREQVKYSMLLILLRMSYIISRSLWGKKGYTVHVCCIQKLSPCIDIHSKKKLPTGESGKWMYNVYNILVKVLLEEGYHTCTCMCTSRYCWY